MEESNLYPFPQADDFDKIIKIINVDLENNLNNKKYLSRLLGDISERQVQYYLSACMYLGLVTSDKKFTQEAKEIRGYSYVRQIAELSRLIVSDKLFGMVYFSEKILGVKFSKTEIADIMHDYVKFSSDEMYNRRAQTVFKWLEWINSQIT